jgi:hypothetical protein
VWAWLVPDLVEAARENAAIAEKRWVQAGYHLQHWFTTLASAEIGLYADDPEAALERLQSDWKRLFFVRQIQIVRVESSHLRGRLLLALARKKDDSKLVELARRDAQSLEREGTPWTLAFGRSLSAATASFTDPTRSLAIVREVEGQFEMLDMKLYAAVAR